MSTQIAALPDAPAATDPVDTFDAKAFAFNAALAAFRTQANAMALEMQINADVAASLILAMALPQFAGTSTSSVTVGTGPRTFGTQAGKGWLPGQIVVATSGANYVKGTVTDYTGTDLDLNVTSINGSGTYAAWNIGLSYDGLALAGSGDNDNILRLLGLVEVPAVVASAIAAGVDASPDIRQTVLSGPVDSNGFSSFGGSTGTPTLTLSGTLKATAAAGGNLNHTGSIVNPVFTAPSGSGTGYLMLGISAAGVVTTSVRTLEPIYQWGGAYSTATGQLTYNIQESTMKAGNGSVAAQVTEVCIGECPFTSGSWSGSPVYYALMARYRSPLTPLPAAGVSQSFAHNVGFRAEHLNWTLMARITANVGNFLAGESFPYLLSYAAGGQHQDVRNFISRLSCMIVANANSGFTAGATSSGSSQVVSTANCSTFQIVQRNW